MAIRPGDAEYDVISTAHMEQGGEYIRVGDKFYRAYTDNDVIVYVYIAKEFEKDSFGRLSKHFRAPYAPEVD